MAAAKRRERERESEEGKGSAEPPPTTAKLGSERSDSLKKAERKERAYEEEQQLQGGASFLGGIGGLVERWYLEVVSVRARRFVQGSAFGGLLILFILLYGALVGVQTVRALRTNPFVVWLGVACVAFFALEVVLKLMAEGDRPLAYFNDGYNVFDFVLAVAGVATLCVGGSQNLVVSLLRMLRLVQLFKLAHKLPRLQLVTEALLYGMISMLWVVLLFALFNFLCALLGTILFRANDPFHFGKFGRSLATLWRIETLNDWETPMYVNMYGCEHYGYYGTAAYNYNNLTLPAAAADTCPGSSCEAVDGESFCGFDYEEEENGDTSDGNGNNNAAAAAAAAANACRSCGSYEAPGDCFRDRRLAGPRAQRECALRCFYYPGNGNGGQRPRVDPATQATDQAEGIRYALSGGGRSSQQQHQQNAAVAQRGRHRFYEVPYSCEVGGRNAAGYRPLGWVAALYFLAVATVGGLILPTLLTAVVTASTVHMSALYQERRENDGKLRGVVRVVAAYLHPTRVVIFRELFDNLDINGNGTLDMAELRPAFTALSDEMLKHMSPEFLQKLFDLVDTDRSGSVDFSEFLLFFSRLTSAMALRLGRPSHEFVTNPRTFEREFVRLCLEMVYGVVPVDMAMDYDENDEGNSENENENDENDDTGGDGFGAADDATPSAAARSSKKAATRGVGIGQQLIDDFAALTGRAPAPGVSISPSTIFDVFDTKQLHRHIRWLASRLEATTTEAEAARRELRMLKETLGAFDAPPPRDAARVPVWGLADKSSGSGSSSSLLQGPSSSSTSSSSAAGAEAAARRARGGSRGSGRAEEATRSQRVRSLEHELWSSLDPNPAVAAGGGGGGNNNAAAAVALAHGDFREQWELKVTANQCLAANRAIAAASGRAIIAEAEAAAAEAERREAEVRALARRRKERKSKARGRRNSSSGNGSSGSGGSKGTTMARDGESERKPKEAVAMMTRHATSIASPRGHGKGRRQNDDSFDFEGENDDDSARDDDETDPMETDLVLDDGFVAGEKIARSAAALVAQWRAAIDLASAAVGSAADRRRRFHAASKNPNLPVPAWSHQGGWAALASHSAAAPGGGGRSHASAGGAASSYMM